MYDSTRDKIDNTSVTAELTFHIRSQALDFAKAWGRKTLMGHTISGSGSGGKTTVSIYNVTEDHKIWIGDYINSVNEQS